MSENIVTIRACNWDYLGSTRLVKQRINAHVTLARTRIGDAYEKFVNECQYELTNRFSAMDGNILPSAYHENYKPMNERDERIELAEYFVMATHHESMYDEYRLVMVWRQFIAKHTQFIEQLQVKPVSNRVGTFTLIGENAGQYIFQLKYNYIPTKVTTDDEYLGLLHGGVEVYIRDTRNKGFGRSDLKNIVSEACRMENYEDQNGRNATMKLLISSTRNTFHIYDSPGSPTLSIPLTDEEESQGEDNNMAN